MRKIDIGPPVQEVEIKARFIPRMRRTKWSPNKTDRVAQFNALTLEVPTEWIDNLRYREMHDAYLKGMERED